MMKFRRPAWARKEPAEQGSAPEGASAKPTRRIMPVLAAVLCVALGLGIAAQVRQTQSGDFLDTARASELVVLLDTLNQREATLRDEVAALQQSLSAMESAGSDNSAALADARSRLEALAIQLGTVAVHGPGVRLTLEDPRGAIGSEVILDLIQELRAAGAEAIQVNASGHAVRIGAGSWVTGRAGGIVLDDKPLRPPFTVTAIGDPPTLAAALNIPGGAVDTVSRNGGQLAIDQLARVEVTALRELAPPEHARPAK